MPRLRGREAGDGIAVRSREPSGCRCSAAACAQEGPRLNGESAENAGVPGRRKEVAGSQQISRQVRRYRCLKALAANVSLDRSFQGKAKVSCGSTAAWLGLQAR